MRTLATLAGMYDETADRSPSAAVSLGFFHFNLQLVLFGSGKCDIYVLIGGVAESARSIFSRRAPKLGSSRQQRFPYFSEKKTDANNLRTVRWERNVRSLSQPAPTWYIVAGARVNAVTG